MGAPTDRLLEENTAIIRVREHVLGAPAPTAGGRGETRRIRDDDGVLGTAHHRVNVAQVLRRTLEGGHATRREEIERRWHAAQANLVQTWGHVDEALVIDSADAQLKIAAHKAQGETSVAEDAPTWAHRLVENARRS